jgi:hypothetical protein
MNIYAPQEIVKHMFKEKKLLFFMGERRGLHIRGLFSIIIDFDLVLAKEFNHPFRNYKIIKE